jgi:hypothetical protein
VTQIYDSFSTGNNQSISFNGLSITFRSDDHMHAIVINGTAISGFSPEAYNSSGWLGSYVNIALSDLNWNVNGMNTIEFIVHNNNTDTSGTKLNATGLSAALQAAYLVNTEEPPPSGVPEPASILLWSLGSLGIFGYARRRSNRLKALA